MDKTGFPRPGHKYKVTYDLFCFFQIVGLYVCSYCKSSLKASKHDNSNFKEPLWCSVLFNFIIIGVVCYSPSSSTGYNTYLMNLITEASHICKSHLLTVSDFNFPDIIWNE